MSSFRDDHPTTVRHHYHFALPQVAAPGGTIIAPGGGGLRKERVYTRTSTQKRCMDEEPHTGDVGSSRHTNATPLVFVCGLWEHIAERELRELFAAYGNVRSVKLVERADGCFSGYALIEMESSEEAAEANQALNNVDVRGHSLCTVHVQPDELLARLVGIPSTPDVTETLQCSPRD